MPFVQFKYRILLWISILCCITIQGYSQGRGKIFSQYFSLKDYNASEQNWYIAQDCNGIMYFGNQEGLLKYDGIHWEKFQLPNLSTLRTVEIADKGEILVGGVNEFGYFAPDKPGRLKYYSLIEMVDSRYLEFGDVWNVEVIDGAWYFQTDKYLFRVKDKKCKTWENFGDMFYLTYKIDNEMYTQVLGKGLYKIIGDELKLLPNGDFFAHKKIHMLLPYQNNILVCTRSNGLFLYNYKDIQKIISFNDISAKAKKINEFLIKSEIYSACKIENDKYAISTISSGTIIIDNDFNVIDIINKESTDCPNSALFIYHDFDGNLWFALDNGILKVELSSPFRYWDSETGLLGSTTVIKEFNHSIYDATGRGVFKLESDNEKNRFGINRFHPVLNFDDQAWELMILDPETFKKATKTHDINKKILGEYYIKNRTLIAVTNKGLFVVNNDIPRKILNYDHLYSAHPSDKDSSKIYLGLTDGLARISYNNGVWYDDGKLPGLLEQTITIQEDKYGNLWFSGGYKGVYRINTKYLDADPQFSQIKQGLVNYDTLSGLPMIEMVLLYKVNDKLKFYTHRGDYIFNYSKNKFEKDPSVGKNYIDNSWKGEIYIDNDSKFWINAIEKNKIKDKYYADTITIRRLKNYSIGSIVRDSSDQLWIGTSECLFRYNERFKKNYFRRFPAIISKVIIKDDSIIYHGINYNERLIGTSKEYIFNYSNQIINPSEISYNYNEISFNFSCTSFESGTENQFSCFLEGYDKVWSKWDSESKKAYTNLPPGNYKFKVKGR